jgi:hypothetical protein
MVKLALSMWKVEMKPRRGPYITVWAWDEVCQVFAVTGKPDGRDTVDTPVALGIGEQREGVDRGGDESQAARLHHQVFPVMCCAVSADSSLLADAVILVGFHG